MKRLFGTICSFIWMLLLSSCTSFLPEFERIEALDKNEHRLATGAYGGVRYAILDGGLLDGDHTTETKAGAAAFHSVGITNKIAWSSIVTAGIISDGERGSGNQFSLTTGPKISLSPNLAFSSPVLITNVKEDYIHYYTYWLPTIYYQHPSWDKGDIKTLIFVREEIIFGDEFGLAFGTPTVGIRTENNLPYHPSVNANVSLIGIYLGITMDLNRD